MKLQIYLLTTIILILMSCGQKGPLYIPEKNSILESHHARF